GTGAQDPRPVFSLSADGQTLLRLRRTASDPRPWRRRAGAAIDCWEILTGLKRQTIRIPSSDVTCICLSPNLAHLASGHADGSIRVWDAETGERVAHSQAHLARVSSVHFSAPGKILVSASADGSVLVSDGARFRHLPSRSCKPSPPNALQINRA